MITGLPPECKAILANFHEHRTHTLRADPLAPTMLVLTGLNIARRGGGSHDAIDCYMTVVPDVWEMMDDWIALEIAAASAGERR